MGMSVPPKDVMGFLQFIVTTLGFLTVIVQLGLEYRWRRRQYAVNMLAEWNTHTADHREAIDRAYPGLLDVSGPQSTIHMSPAQAQALYDATASVEPNLFATERHVIELLNYCEFVAISGLHKVAARAILEASFLSTLHVWYHELLPYVTVTKAHRGYNPWQPLDDYISQTRCPHCPPSSPAP
jgi:hypothetical protein